MRKAISVILTAAPVLFAQTVYHYQDGAGPLPQGVYNSAYSAVAAGANFSLALRTDGVVSAWGNAGVAAATAPTGLNNVGAIAAGVEHALALRKDGTVVAWGGNTYGQCNIPAGLAGVTAIAAGEHHSVALKSDGTVVAWGNSEGLRTAVPAGLTNVVSIAAGRHHTVAVKADGTAVGWGMNTDGQIPDPSKPLLPIAKIVAGALHNVAITKDFRDPSGALIPSRVIVLGRKTEGQGTTTVHLGANVKDISAGPTSTIVLTKDGKLYVYGAVPPRTSGAPVPADATAAAISSTHVVTLRRHVWDGQSISGWQQLPGSVSQVVIAKQGDEQRGYNAGRSRPGDLTYLNAFEEMWAIGTADTGNGNKNVLRYDWTVAGGQWLPVTGQAIRIANGPDGSAIRPWVITAQNGIWRRDVAAGWVQQTGTAQEIAIGPQGDHYVIGNRDAIVDNVWKWNGSMWVLLRGIPARKLAVEPDGSLWAVGADLRPYRYENGVWVRKPGNITSLAIGPSGAVWATDNTPKPGPNNTTNYGILRWMGDQWKQENGSAVSLAVGEVELPYAILSDGSFWVSK